jgi:hypothetical protein
MSALVKPVYMSPEIVISKEKLMCYDFLLDYSHISYFAPALRRVSWIAKHFVMPAIS